MSRHCTVCKRQIDQDESHCHNPSCGVRKPVKFTPCVCLVDLSPTSMKTKDVIFNALFDGVENLKKESKKHVEGLKDLNLRLVKLNADIEDLKEWAATLPKP